MGLITVAKRQGPYAQNQNDRDRSPQTTVHVYLQILIGFARAEKNEQAGYNNAHAMRSVEMLGHEDTTASIINNLHQ